MNFELVGPFSKSSKDIFAQVGNIQMEVEDAYEKREVELKNNIGIVVGLTGSLKGQVIIDIPSEVGKKIASNMMGGMPIATLDDIAKSAICEMGNMIMGSAATNLYDLGLTIDITPPSIISGREIKMKTVEDQVLCIPFKSEEDIIEINISVKEK
ncbi:chemotaxis protein CheX [Sporosalibacterium faouarense]|uniref:chemotaxis protein CheX n=1 Tax=Sporosalibacterium faouarense TaxID=516123 RepID=UPI00192C4D76|nr:chemotaxis protein CheX [Sporosalibacterium faouarense]